MDRKLVITKIKDKIISSVMENGEMIELHCSAKGEAESAGTLGNIYVGKVKNIVSHIGAAFIEIAPGVEGYYDLARNKNPIFTHKIGNKPLCMGDELLVQIQKEAVKTKQLTVTSNFAFTGKYVVLTYGDLRTGVSGKILGQRKKELQQWIEPFKGETYGIIVRTNAQNCARDTLVAEMKRLGATYDKLIDTAHTSACYSCLWMAPKPYLSDLRNVYQKGLKEIVIEDDSIFKEVETFLRDEQPEELGILSHYEDTFLPLRKLYRVEHVIDIALREKVWLKSGAYIVIQHTEAMTVIDVNTGKCDSKKNDEDTYLKINLEAAKQVTKQMRLRNLSGIILIDFINLSKQEHMECLLETFRKELKKDPVQADFVDVTKLQLVEATRKKVRKPFYESYYQ